MVEIADPFLTAHKVENFFDLGTALSSISIRDQMIRARMFIDRAFEQELIGQDRSLLVIGAGAAGVTAGIRAAQFRVPTTVVERNDHPFECQAGCSTRYIDPTLYDWAVDHWPNAAFPWSGTPDMPLECTANWANRLASSWEQQLGQAHADLSHLSIRCGWEVIDAPLGPESDGLISVKMRSREGHLSTERFRTIVWCGGWGHEAHQLANFTSYRFWDTDHIAERNLGLSRPPRVLISGGGDGALQDLLRVLTGQSAHQILEILRNDQTIRRAIDAIEPVIQSKEDQAQRAMTWSRTRIHDHRIQQRLHDVHLDQVRWLLNTSNAAPAVGHHLPVMLRKPFPATVELAHSCSHFSRCYPLNRFLSLLFIEYLRAQGNTNFRLRSYTITKDIRGTNNHTCPTAGAPLDCWGHPHEVSFEKSECSQFNTGDPHGAEVFDVILLRHSPISEPPPRRRNTISVRDGAGNPHNPSTKVEVVERRHALPYHVP